MVERRAVPTRYLRDFGFELALPHGLPPQLSTPELQLRWALLFHFDLDGGRRISWRLPIDVQPAARAMAAPGVAALPSNTLHVDVTDSLTRTVRQD